MAARKKIVHVHNDQGIQSGIETPTSNSPSSNVMTFRQSTVIATATVGGLLIVALLFFCVNLQISLNNEKSQLLRANQKLVSLENGSNNDSNSEITQLVNQVGQLIVLPTGEQPAIATVTDLSQLKGQAFFANAAVGDKVLIYQNAKEAILYRPSTNKIIEVAPVTDNSAAATNTKALPSKK